MKREKPPRPRPVKVTAGHYTFGPYTLKRCGPQWLVFGGPVDFGQHPFASLTTAYLACRRTLEQTNVGA